MTLHNADMYLADLAKSQNLSKPKFAYIEPESAESDYDIFLTEFAAIIARYPEIVLTEDEQAELDRQAKSWTIWKDRRARVQKPYGNSSM